MAYSVLEKIESFTRPLTISDLAQVLDVDRKTIDNMLKPGGGGPPVIPMGNARITKFDPKTLVWWFSQKNPIMAKAHRSS